MEQSGGRLANALMSSRVAYARNSTQSMLDLRFGGMNGYTPDLSEWVSNAAYKRHHLIPILIRAPRGFDYLPEPDYWYGALRSMIERHSERINGLTATYEVDIQQGSPVGGSGMFQDEFVNITETPSKPVHGLTDKYGMAFSAFVRGWQRGLMMDPHTKIADIGTNADGNRPTDMLPDMYTCSVLYIEPDPLMNSVVQSWLCTNMMPARGPEITGSKDVSAGLEMSKFEVEFTAITQYGLGVNAFAQKILDDIDITGANSNLRPAFASEISADVKAAFGSYKAQAESVGATALRL